MNDYAWRWANEHKEEHGVHVRSRSMLVLQGIFWILVYIILSTVPLFVLLIGPRPPGREFWREFSVALGFAGLAMVALQFVLTARFKVVKAPWGRITLSLLERYLAKPQRRDSQEVFICGPKPMMDAVESALVSLGVPVGDFHSERFDLV